MAVVLGLLPTKGLALPFISYGGSAMMIVLAEVGVLLALAREGGMTVVDRGRRNGRTSVSGHRPRRDAGRPRCAT